MTILPLLQDVSQISGAHWTTVGAFWATVLIALIAVVATAINYTILRTQLDPHVIIHAIADERRPSIINLIIENVGNRIAKDITFTADAPVPERAYGFADAPIPQPMSRGPLITGIKALAPGDRRVITWGQYHGLMKGLRNGQIMLNVRYRSDRMLFWQDQWHENECPIDMRSFEATDASDSNWDKKAAEHLKEIAAHLQQVVRGKAEVKVSPVERSEGDATATEKQFEQLAEPQQFRARMLREHAESFRLFYDVVSAVEGAFQESVQISDNVRRAVDMLMVQGYKAYSSVYVLLVRGHVEDGATIARRMLELAVQTVYIAAESEEDVRCDRADRYLANLWDAAPDTLRASMPANARLAWERHFEKHGHHLPKKRRSWGPNFREMFRAIGCEATYVQDYTFLSGIAHGSPPNLIYDYRGPTVEVRHGRHVSLILTYATRYFLAIIEQWNLLFGLIDSDQYSHFVSRATEEERT